MTRTRVSRDSFLDSLSEQEGSGSRILGRFIQRHTSFVSWMRVGLPILAGALVIIVVVWPQITDSENRFVMGYAELSRSESRQPKMTGAYLSGIDSRKQPYAVTAHEILPLNETGELFALKAPQADITLASGTWVALSSDMGVYQKSIEILGLQDNVSFYHDSGFEFYTSRAYIDVNKGMARGHEPVVGQGPGGKITARGFYLPGDQNRVIFTGKSHLTLYPSQMRAG